MLSPNVIDVGNYFADAFSEIVSVDRFAFAGMNILVGKLSPDPAWLGPVRTRIGMLSGASKKWQEDRPVIWSDVLQPFADYSTLFKGFTETSEKFGNSADIWVEALQQLKKGLEDGGQRTTKALAGFTDHIENIKNVESLLTESLDMAWGELASEEKQMVALAEQITHLQDQVDQLQDNITNAEITSGKNYFQSAVSISYTLATTAGAEIPYLAILGEVFTIGKMAYDLIVTDKEISETIDKIVDLRVKATEEAQAAAATKAVIQLIYKLNLSLAATQNKLPPFVDMWSTERDKIAVAIETIQAGLAPKTMIELISMPAALASWEMLADFVPKLTKEPQPGKSVTITTSSTNRID